jgi:hypothetical protein
MTTSDHVCITFPLYQYISIPSLPSIFLYDFAPDYTVSFSHDRLSWIIMGISSDFLQIFLRLSFFYGYSHDYPQVSLGFRPPRGPTRGNAAYGVAGAAFSHVSEMDRRLRQRAATGI